MREVAWVIFDEVHYMRDKCKFITLLRIKKKSLTVNSSRRCLGRDHHPASG